MKRFDLPDELKDELRLAARRYLRAIERARARQDRAKHLREASPDPLNDWRVDLAEALTARDCERASQAEGRVARLIRSITGGEPVPGVEVGPDPITAIPGFPAVEAEGHVFTIAGEDGLLVVRPAWMTVRVE